MTEAEWLASSNPIEMFKAAKLRLRRRKLRLFAVACSRRIESLLTDARSREAIATAARFADEEANEREMQVAKENAAAAHKDAFRLKGKRGSCLEWAAEYTVDPFAIKAAQNVSWMSATAGEVAEVAIIDYSVQASLVRDIFGNPFHPVTLSPAWLTPAVVSLGQTIYDERAFERMPELSDVLEQAGCDASDLLNHCRGGGEHVRGCWVLDLVLGKS